MAKKSTKVANSLGDLSVLLNKSKVAETKKVDAAPKSVEVIQPEPAEPEPVELVAETSVELLEPKAENRPIIFQLDDLDELSDDVVIKSVRKTYGDFVKDYSDSTIVKTTRAWVGSDDWANDTSENGETLLQWLSENSLSVVDEVIESIAEVPSSKSDDVVDATFADKDLMKEAESEPASAESPTQEEQVAEESDPRLPTQEQAYDQGFLDVNFIAEKSHELVSDSLSAMTKVQTADGQEEELLPEDVKEREDVIENLNFRQLLSVATDVLRERSDADLQNMIIETMGRLYHSRATQQSHILTAVANSQRYVDFVVVLLKALSIEVPTTNIASDLKVEGRSIKFESLYEQHSLSDLELGVISASRKIKALVENSARLNKVSETSKSFELDAASKQAQINKLTTEIRDLLLAQEREKAKPRPVEHKIDGKQVVVIRWTATLKNKAGKANEVTFYLTQGTGKNLIGGMSPTDEKIKLSNYRRSKEFAHALRFVSVEDARLTIQRLTKYVTKLEPEAKITERSLKVAQIVALFEQTF